MTPTDLKSWRARHKLTQRDAADMFGITYRTIQNMESGVTVIKPVYDLACETIDKRAETEKLWNTMRQFVERNQPTEG